MEQRGHREGGVMVSRKESLADLLADLNLDRMALTAQRDALQAENQQLRQALADLTADEPADRDT